MRLIDKDALIEAMGEEPLVWNDEADEIAERMQWQIDMSIIEAAPTIELCEDAISREEAIEAFIAWEKREFGYSDLNRGERFISAIESLPSVAPKHSGEAAEMVEDAISRAEVIKNIECWKDEVESEHDEYFNLGLWQAINEVKRAPSVAPSRPQEWTPCSERLPEENGKSYLTYQGGEGWGFCQVLNYYNGWNCYRGDKEHEIKGVVAWMPLPEPWKGADDEQSDR